MEMQRNVIEGRQSCCRWRRKTARRQQNYYSQAPKARTNGQVLGPRKTIPTSRVTSSPASWYTVRIRDGLSECNAQLVFRFKQKSPVYCSDRLSYSISKSRSLSTSMVAMHALLPDPAPCLPPSRACLHRRDAFPCLDSIIFQKHNAPGRCAICEASQFPQRNPALSLIQTKLEFYSSLSSAMRSMKYSLNPGKQNSKIPFDRS